MLAFLRGSGRAAQLYVKLLPDGEPVQLTHEETLKTMPAFSPDGSRIAYGSAGHNWETWVEPVLGGPPQLLLSNATGLTWIDPQHVMFSEIKSGVHLSVVTSTESRSEQRDVYVPPNQDDMAHVSYLSPNHKWVLVVEMEADGRMGQCRLAPFSGKEAVRLVGPAKGGCDYAAWSPDGKWMYFNSDAGGHGYHIWCQAFPSGKPQQLTAGLTEEDGLAMAPDGRSIVTSVGTLNGSVWVHDQHGDRQISSEGFCYRPKLTNDGRQLFYLRAENESGEETGGELWVADLTNGESSKVLPGIAVLTFSVSPDGKRVVFDTLETGGKHRLWLASTEHRSAPRSIESGVEGSFPMYSRSGRIYFVSPDKQQNVVYRVNEDGTGEQKVSAGLDYVTGISPDERFIAERRNVNPDNNWMQVDAVPTSGGAPVPLCSGWCGVDWARDGKAMYFYWMSSWSNVRTYVVPISGGADLPNLPKTGFQSEDELRALHVPEIDAAASPGPNHLSYSFSKRSSHWNLYRLPLR
jgi:Tol biopolymer transport system component